MPSATRPRQQSSAVRCLPCTGDRHWLARFGAAASAPADLGAVGRLATDGYPAAASSIPGPTALRRQNPRQEPSALDAHAGICAGGSPNLTERRAVPTATSECD